MLLNPCSLCGLEFSSELVDIILQFPLLLSVLIGLVLLVPDSLGQLIRNFEELFAFHFEFGDLLLMGIQFPVVLREGLILLSYLQFKFIDLFI